MSTSFKHMAEILQPAQSERYMIDIFEVSPEDVQTMRLRDLFNRRREYAGFEPGKYARLSRRSPGGGRITPPIMTDTWMEQATNREFVRQARGDVLVAGLGIGMVLMAIQDKEEVTSITVVEKEQEVIDLVKPQLPLKDWVTVVHSDIFEFQTKMNYDVIYFDIWDSICADNWEQMKTLHRKFARRKKPGGWMGSWREDDCRHNAKIGW